MLIEQPVIGSNNHLTLNLDQVLPSERDVLSSKYFINERRHLCDDTYGGQKC